MRTTRLANPEDRSILIREMRRLGLPAQGEREVHFTVLTSTLGETLMATEYSHTSGTDLMICEVIVLVNQNRQVHVLRELQLQKTDVDVPEVTTWSLIDLADVDVTDTWKSCWKATPTRITGLKWFASTMGLSRQSSPGWAITCNSKNPGRWLSHLTS